MTRWRVSVGVCCLAVLLVSAGCNAVSPGGRTSPSATAAPVLSNCTVYAGPSTGMQPERESPTSSHGIVWKRSLEAADDSSDVATSIVQAHGTGTVMTGTTDAQLWIVHLNETAAPQWTVRLGGRGEDVGHDITRTADGGYLISGTKRPSVGHSGVAWLVKVTATGDVVWNRTLGPSGSGAPAVVRTSDGGFGVALKNMGLAKVDPSGHTEWMRQYDIGASGTVRELAQTADGGFVVVANDVRVDNRIPRTMDGTEISPLEKVPVVLKVNETGHREWCRHDNSRTSVNDVVALQDGGVAVTGIIGLWKLNASGGTEWLRNLARLAIPTELRRLEDGGYAITGSDTSDVRVVEVDETGTQRGFAVEPDLGTGRDLVRADDGAYIVVAEEAPYRDEHRDVVVLKVAVHDAASDEQRTTS